MSDYSNSWSTPTSTSTGKTRVDWKYGPVDEPPVDPRVSKKDQIRSIIDGDKYLLQELLTELRNEKIDKILDARK